MIANVFRTDEGTRVPAVTAEEMREVDRLATEVFQLDILQMMENAGRNLAENAREMIDAPDATMVILAGSGGNGGGGLCCARHLHNHGYHVKVIVSRPSSQIRGAAAAQWHILETAGMQAQPDNKVANAIRNANLVIDALIGYSLYGAPRGYTAELITLCNQYAKRVLALDIPSGLDATTGETPGAVVRADRIMTLALPKTGLGTMDCPLTLADIGIPNELYSRIGITLNGLFHKRYWFPLYSA